MPSPSTAASTCPTWSPTSALALTVIPASPSARDLELDDVRRLVGDERGRADGSQQLFAIEHGARRVAGRHDLLVVRELAVDQPADQVDPVEVEQDLVLAGGEDDLDRVVDVGQDPGELVERPRRDHHAGLGDGIEDRDRLDRDPVVVGRSQRELVALELGQDAGQDRPGLITGGRERRLGQRLAQDVLGDPRRGSLAGRPDRRELVRVDALDVGLEPPAPKVEQVAGLELEIDPVSARQGVDQVGQQLGRDGGRPIGVDLAGDPIGDPDLQVRRRQLQPGVLRLEQDVGQDRQGAPVGHGATDDGQAARQVLLHDREFHVGLHSTLRVGGSNGRGRRWDGRGTRCRRPGPRGCPRVVGIFPLSSHLVITVVMLWNRWTATLPPARSGRGRLAGRGGWASAACGPAWGRAVDDRSPRRRAGPRRPSRPRRMPTPGGWSAGMSTTAPCFPPESRGYPQQGPLGDARHARIRAPTDRRGPGQSA